MDYIGILLKFLGSFGLFIFGISLLSSGLQKTAGSRMKRILGNVSKNRFSGVLFGAGVTALIQSSTATTVMAVGFVNAGIIALPQIVGIIMGANVGTTTTAWLVSSVEWSHFFKPDAIGAVCAAFGALMLLFTKDKSKKNIAEVIVGFGVLFLGLSQMPAALKPLAELDAVRQMFVTMGANPFLGIIAGILVTVIIQSSTASIGILQSMAFAGMVPWNAAVYIVLGQNIGTCLTAILSSIGTTKNAKAAAYIHLVYNVIGAAIFCAAAMVYFSFWGKAFGETVISATEISIVHTGYNFAALLLLFPFGGLILKLSARMAGISGESETDETELAELDDNILETPSFALENSKKAISKLMSMMRANLVLGVDTFLTKNYRKISTLWINAEKIDKVNDKINSFLTKLFHEKLNTEQSTSASAFIHIVISLKRISNRTKGFAALTDSMREGNLTGACPEVEKLDEIYNQTMLCYDTMVKAFEEDDTDSINLTMNNADAIAELREEYKALHLTLTADADYNVEVGILYSEAARHLARIAHNMRSVVETMPHADNPDEEIAEAMARR